MGPMPHLDPPQRPSGSAGAVTDAYERRAADYIRAVGSVDDAHALDRLLITDWARSCTGRIVDAGCGPGHWTDHLHRLGIDAVGVDLTPAFLQHARQAYPDITFQQGDLDELDFPSGSVGGVLAWFSVIHRPPESMATALGEFRRVLRTPGGRLLLGFFSGRRREPFDHAVVTAYRWPVDDLCQELTDAGFTVLETHFRQLRGERPAAAIIAGTEPDDRPFSR